MFVKVQKMTNKNLNSNVYIRICIKPNMSSYRIVAVLQFTELDVRISNMICGNSIPTFILGIVNASCSGKRGQSGSVIAIRSNRSFWTCSKTSHVAEQLAIEKITVKSEISVQKFHLKYNSVDSRFRLKLYKCTTNIIEVPLLKLIFVHE